MSCVSYTTPALVHTTLSSVTGFIDAMNTGMLAAGLTKATIPSGETYTDSFSTKTVVDYVDMTALPGSNVSSDGKHFYFCSAYYNLPVGDGSIELEDDEVDPQYKKLISESYDSTPCQIKIHFIYVNTATDGSAQQALSARPFSSVVTIHSSDGKEAARFRAAPSSGSNSLSYSTNHNHTYGIKGQSYISLTGRQLTVSIGCHNIISSTFPSGSFYRYMVQFSLYRNNGDITAYGSYANNVAYASVAYYNDDASDIRMTYYNSAYRDKYEIANFNNNFTFWPESALTSMSSGNHNIGPVFAKYNSSSHFQVPNFVVTKINDTELSFITLIYKYDDHYIKGQFLNLGLTERSQCPVVRQSTTYSWAYLYEPSVTYTTSTVGGP